MAKRYFEGARENGSSDGGMMPSGMGSHANMPTEVVMKEWSKTQVGMPESLNDGITGIDGQIGADNAKKHSGLSPKKV